jgi:hypothetical protein
MKMALLSKEVCMFKVIPVKIPLIFFTKTDNSSLPFREKHKYIE